MKKTLNLWFVILITGVVYRCLILLLALALGAIGKTSAENLSIADVKHITSANGLSSQRVFAILEDNNGAMWFSTRNGVDRYNGREIKNYELLGDFYCGDLAGRVIMLAGSGSNIIAYDNLGIIYEFSAIYDRFNIVYKLSDDVALPIRLNKYLKAKGVEYFALTKGLYARESGKTATAIATDINVNDIIEVDGTLFLATTTGLRTIGKKGNSSQFGALASKNIQTLFLCKDTKKLYVGTFNDGLWVVDLASSAVSRVEAQTEIFSNPIRAIQSLDKNTIAVGIDGGGIYTLSIPSGNIRVLINTEDNTEYCLFGNGIYALTRDSQGSLWAGSYTGGVSRIMFANLPFKHITHEKGSSNSLANNNVNAIAENTDGAIWYGTDRGVSINKGAIWTHALKSGVALALQPVGNGQMLLGTYGEGIFVLDAAGNVTKRLTKQAANLTSNYIFSIKKDLAGNYWVGALDGNLMLLNNNFETIATYPVTLVHSIEVIDKNRVAVATVDGFYIIQIQSGEVTQYASAKELYNQNVSAYIVPMLPNSDGTMWLGTEGGGLNLYDPASRKVIRNYKIADGLPSNDIFALQRDNIGRVWVSTGNGIAVLSETDFSSIKYLNGVASEYNKNAATKLKSGDMVFGSTSGAMRFETNQINTLSYNATMRVSGFAIEGISQDERDKSAPKMWQGIKTGKISLPYAHNSFTLDFECIHLKYQDDIGYTFILDGYDKEWSPVHITGHATYKHVMPGKYTLRLRAVRLCDGATIDEREISININNPWWSSWWAWLIYIAIVGLFTYFIVRYKLYQLQKQQDEEKIRFFINTAHDIRTPVTLAMAPLDDIQREEPLSDNAAYLLTVARQNVQKLSSITSQLLEFEKLESKKQKMQLVAVDLRDVLKGEIACFSNVCEKKDIKLSLSLPDEAATIMGDIALIEMIFDNLISNACKYTKSGGKVMVSLSVSANKVTANVTDTGIGIPQNERKHIFTDIYRAKNARESQEIGTGFGLLQVKRVVKLLNGAISFKSEEGKGTEFSVTFERSFEKALQHERKNQTNAMLNEVVPEIAIEQNSPDEPKDSTLLIVEDNDDLRNYLGKIFSREYSVALTSTANEALQYLTTGYPDLIISDVMMPGIQGDDFCHRVKSSPETAGIPVILLTAKTNHDAIVSGFSKGADDYVSKPFNSEILKLKVRGLLENRNRMRNYLLQRAMQYATDSKPEVPQEQPEATAPSDSDKIFMKRVTSLIIKNISDSEFNIDSLCREMAMSRTLFYNRLKALTGKAPQEFMRLLRLERAAELLRQGEPVAEVAERTGFANVKYFSTVFKKHFGVQPSRLNAE